MRFILIIIFLFNCDQKETEQFKILKIKENHSVNYYIESQNGKRIKIEGMDTTDDTIGFPFQIREFSEGLANFSESSLYWKNGGFIDTKGNIVFKYSDGSYSDFKEGLSVKHQFSFWNRKLDFIDNTGKKVMSNFYGAYSFSQGLAPVSKVGKINAIDDEVPIFTHLKWGYINKKNQFIIQPQFDDARPFSSEKVAFVKKYGKWKVIKDKGERVFDLYVGGKWGIINLNGNLVKSYTFQEVGVFTDGLAPVLIGGKEKISLEYIAPEGNPYAYIRNEGGKWGYINSKGEFKIKTQFNEAEDFKNGIANIILNGKKLKINTKGEFIKE
jgi:hypothetical protein